MEFMAKFNDILRAESKSLGQQHFEWRVFLEFCESYFRHRMVWPTVVEIGTLHCSQRPFYKELLSAEYIGIDIDPASGADIIGDSGAPGTMEKLRGRLQGRPISLLFIDGAHGYESVKRDYEMYGSMSTHLVALHDIFCADTAEIDVRWLWLELCENEKEYTHISFHKIQSHDKTSVWPGHEMGIGLIVKGEA